MSPAANRRARPILQALWLLPLLVLTVHGDVIVLGSGKKLRGHPMRRGSEIYVNVYGCGVPAMTRGVRRLRALDVREVLPEPPEDDLRRRWAEVGARDVDRRVGLLREAQSARLGADADRLAEEILALRPGHEEALRVLGGEKNWMERRRGQPALDPRLAVALRRVLRLERGAERKAQAERLAETFGYEPGADAIERMARSLEADRGLRRDLALSIEADAFPQGRYTLYVPPDYDPLVPRPLLLALHGGGIMHETGPSVRGGARDAVAFFLEGAQELGWFLLCPDAVEAPWPTAGNGAFLDAVLEEVTHLWNVDLERVHLAGQGGGGDGAWRVATRIADRLASVSVASAGKPIGVAATAGKTALWIYHGDADVIVPVDPVRRAADALLRLKADFVYCELPREAHGFPLAARRDLFRFIAPKRRRRARSAWPSASFAQPSGRAARAAFGDPEQAWGVGLPAEPDALVALLESGRLGAEAAARRLAVLDPKDRGRVAARVREVVGNGKAPPGARRWGAWLCGAWVDLAAVSSLGTVLRTGRDPRLLRAAAQAVGRIGSSDSIQDLHWALGDAGRRFKALPGAEVSYPAFERTCRLGAALAEAIGRVGVGDDSFFGAVEEQLVRGVLMDRRPIQAHAAGGEDPARLRTLLAVAVAAAYRRLGAEPTLFDMLREAVKRDPVAAAALRRALGD